MTQHLSDDQFWTLINRFGLTSIELPGFMSYHFGECTSPEHVNDVYADLVETA